MTYLVSNLNEMTPMRTISTWIGVLDLYSLVSVRLPEEGIPALKHVGV